MTLIQDPNRNATMFHFMNNIEVILINDEILLRLLTYLPKGYDKKTKKKIPDPLDISLPNLVNDSTEYWDLVEDRIRQGDRRMNINDEAKCVIYIQEGRSRDQFRNTYLVNQEVLISIIIHESFEKDWRMSRISDRINELIVFKEDMAGFGKFEFVGSDRRDAPIGYRRIDYRYVFNNNKRMGGAINAR